MRYPELKEKKLAEFTGIMLGDGSIGEYECKKGDGTTNTQRSVAVTLSSEEEEFSEYVISLFNDLFNISPAIREKKNENVIEIRSFRKNLFNFLTKDLGLKVSPKWDRAKIPEIYENDDHRREVLRGYFDTDGSVVLTDNNGTLYPRLEMKISPSPMQNQFVEILEKENFNFGNYDIGKGKVRIQMNGKTQLQKWLNEIGFANRKHLNKAEKALN